MQKTLKKKFKMLKTFLKLYKNEKCKKNFSIYTVRQKKGTNFVLCASLLIFDQTGEFFSHILRNA